MINLPQKLYPYFSIFLIEVTKSMEVIDKIEAVLPLFLQVIIGVLTIFKLVKDINKKIKK